MTFFCVPNPQSTKNDIKKSVAGNNATRNISCDTDIHNMEVKCHPLLPALLILNPLCSAHTAAGFYFFVYFY